jgi:hypothetical protein
MMETYIIESNDTTIFLIKEPISTQTEQHAQIVYHIMLQIHRRLRDNKQLFPIATFSVEVRCYDTVFIFCVTREHINRSINFLEVECC